MVANAKKFEKILLKDEYPELFKRLDVKKSGFSTQHLNNLAKNSQRYAWWVCPTCQKSFKERVYTCAIGFAKCSHCQTAFPTGSLKKKPTRQHAKEIITPSNVLTPPIPTKKRTVKNPLSQANPILAKQWHPTKNEALTPADINCSNSKLKVWWKCPEVNCQHEWEATVANRHRLHSGCPLCARKKAREKRLGQTFKKTKKTPIALNHQEAPQETTIPPMDQPIQKPMVRDEIDQIWNYRLLTGEQYLVFNHQVYQIENERGKRLIGNECLTFCYQLFKHLPQTKGQSILDIYQYHQEVLNHLGFKGIESFQTHPLEGEFLVKLEKETFVLYLSQSFRIIHSNQAQIQMTQVEEIQRVKDSYYDSRKQKYVNQQLDILKGLGIQIHI